MTDVKRGIAIAHFDRTQHLPSIVEAMLDTMPDNCRLVVVDDGTTTLDVRNIRNVILITGPNRGVAHNKNRALWALQDCHYLAIIEDDLKPTEGGWFEKYEEASKLSGIHHFCRVQDKEIPETIPSFSAFMGTHKLTPIFGSSPRGDLTFVTSRVTRDVGAFNPNFYGAGHAHGEWTERCIKAGLVSHPAKYVDIKEARDKFEQVGDTEGGRWKLSKDELNRQLAANRTLLKRLQKTDYVYHPLVFG
jgi:glycosyltransferase involved in cell wall biosynthesis